MISDSDLVFQWINIVGFPEKKQMSFFAAVNGVLISLIPIMSINF